MKLKKVLFVIEHMPKTELFSRTLMDLWQQGIEAERCEVLPEEGRSEEVSETNEHTLIVTDNQIYASQMKAAGYAVAAYYNEECGKSVFDAFPGIKYVITDLSGVDGDYCRMVFARENKLPLTIMETDRCIIREETPEDLDRLYEIYSNHEITRYMEPLFPSREEEERYIRDYIDNVYSLFGYGMWVVEHKEKGLLIGRAGIEPKGDSNELGYMIAAEYQRQGYASEVMREIYSYGKFTLGLQNLVARIDRNNLPSIALCQKIGMEYEIY